MQQTTEVVPLKPAVLTPWAALRVNVVQDTPEMDLHAQVKSVQTCNAVQTFVPLKCIEPKCLVLGRNIVIAFSCSVVGLSGCPEALFGELLIAMGQRSVHRSCHCALRS